MKATYIVKTKNGQAYTWSFTESKNDGDYGNGIYIGVITPSGDMYSLDMRYATDYKFHKECVEYLRTYYGKNLEELHLQRLCKGLEER